MTKGVPKGKRDEVGKAEEVTVRVEVNVDGGQVQQVEEAAQQLKQAIEDACALWGCPHAEVNARYLGKKLGLAKFQGVQPMVLSYALERGQAFGACVAAALWLFLDKDF